VLYYTQINRDNFVPVLHFITMYSKYSCFIMKLHLLLVGNSEYISTTEIN